MAKAKAQQSKRSRAARRAATPPPTTDLSPPSLRRHERPSVLAAQHAAGVTKKKKKTTTSRRTHMSARARRRHERGVEMAEAVTERTERKVGQSLRRQHVVDGRRQGWEAINREVVVAAADVGGGEAERGGEAEDGGVGEGEMKKTRSKRQFVRAALAVEGSDTDEDIGTVQAQLAGTTVDEDLDEVL